MSEIDFSAIWQLMQGSGMGSSSQIGDLLRQKGISADNPAAAEQLLEQLGFKGDGMNKEAIIGLINQMTGGLSSEMRQQFSGMIEQAARQIGCEELPADVSDFLKQWKGC